LHRSDDSQVNTAPAEMPVQGIANLILARPGAVPEQRRRGDDEAAGAETALQGVLRHERLLKWMKRGLRKSLDGDDVVTHGLACGQGAGRYGTAVDQHDTRTTLPPCAPDACSPEAQLIPQNGG
jgi:hypothetical protein